MTSSRSFSTLAALLVVVSLAAVGPAAAVSVDDGDTDVVAEAEVGTQVSATVTLTDLYREPNWNPWTLQGETELQNVTWSVTFIDQQGNEFDTATYDGQQLNGGNGVQISTKNNVAEVRVELVGTVPEPEEYTYPEEEMFVVASLTQARGEGGSRNEIGTWEAHHFTTAEEGEPGSQEARRAIANARAAIESAKAAGADTTEANQSLTNAIEFYESGQFTNAVENARAARQEAQQAESKAKSSRQTTRLLLFGGAGVVVLLLIGGGFWFYRQQQDDYDKLG